jgi:hypothetical protein
MLQFFVQDQYQHELLHRDLNHQEEEHQFQQENVYQNDMLVQYLFYELMENDEMQAKLIVEEIHKELYNPLNYEYELYRNIIDNY